MKGTALQGGGSFRLKPREWAFARLDTQKGRPGWSGPLFFAFSAA